MLEHLAPWCEVFSLVFFLRHVSVGLEGLGKCFTGKRTVLLFRIYFS